MKVSGRLFLGFAIVTTLAIIVGAVGIAGMRELRKASLSMYEQQVMGLEYLGRATGALKQARLDSRQIVISSFYDDQKFASDAKKHFDSSTKDFNYWMDKAYEVATTDELKKFHEIITGLFNDVYLPNTEKINSASINDMPDHVNNLQLKVLLSSTNDVSEQMENLIIGMMDLNSALAQQTSIKNDRMTESLILLQYIILAAAVGIAVIVALYVTKSITTAYKTIEDLNKTILSSIEYSSKIQRNLLPLNTVFEQAFSDYSITWEPRDIVGGDMYWLKKFEDGALLGVCDCTGHGTPGALLTMLVASTLDSIVNNTNYKDTAEVVWMLDRMISSILNAKTVEENYGDGIKDGCDLAVLYVAKDGSVALSAGNMHVFVCDGKEVTRIKGQKLFVGEGKIKGKDEVKIITIPANPGNKFYIASDGLYDQPGGKPRRPFGYKTFKRIILENHNEKQAVISEKIWAAFKSHECKDSRRDDVELITFKP